MRIFGEAEVVSVQGAVSYRFMTGSNCPISGSTITKIMVGVEDDVVYMELSYKEDGTSSMTFTGGSAHIEWTGDPNRQSAVEWMIRIAELLDTANKLRAQAGIPPSDVQELSVPKKLVLPKINATPTGPLNPWAEEAPPAKVPLESALSTKDKPADSDAGGPDGFQES